MSITRLASSLLVFSLPTTMFQLYLAKEILLKSSLHSVLMVTGITEGGRAGLVTYKVLRRFVYPVCLVPSLPSHVHVLDFFSHLHDFTKRQKAKTRLPCKSSTQICQKCYFNTVMNYLPSCPKRGKIPV